MLSSLVEWPGEVDAVMTGDLTAAAAFITPAGGAVVTGVAPCGLNRRHDGMVGFTSSLGFGKKLERIVRDPRVALAYHSREHGFTESPRFVLVQGSATVDLQPSMERLDAFAPQAERYLGALKHGRVWDWLLREYYAERVFIDVRVSRVMTWDNLAVAGDPHVWGAPVAEPPPSQAPPSQGTGPRIDVDRAAQQLSALPHRLIAYRGADGLPVVTPVQLGGHDQHGLRVVAPAGALPAGHRRAGLLGHSYRPQLVGLRTRAFTGWLQVDADGVGTYAPHTSKGFAAPPLKTLLLVTNGLMAKVGMWRGRSSGFAEKLAHIAADRSASAGP